MTIEPRQTVHTIHVKDTDSKPFSAFFEKNGYVPHGAEGKFTRNYNETGIAFMPNTLTPGNPIFDSLA